MKILLIAMPDAANNFHRMIQVPNLGLCNLAAYLDGHEVKILDLVLVHQNIQQKLINILKEFRPDVVGLSSMSFQYQSALKIRRIVREFDPQITTVLGGYHATILYDEIEAFDFIVRGEGELVFSQLIERLSAGAEDFSNIKGLSYYDGEEQKHNEMPSLMDLSSKRPPRREGRMVTNFQYFHNKVDCVETSRGCTMPCSFCSISNMYGRSFRLFPLDKVIDDLRQIKKSGGKTVFIVDDNITLDVPRFIQLCEEIIRQDLNTIEYIVQASVVGMTQDTELVKVMAKANFKIVFLGIESVLQKNLKFLQKGDIRKKTEQAIALLREQKIAILGGFIIGNPDDTKEDIQEIFRQARRMKIDLATVQCVTPYPKTKLREELMAAGLVTNPDNLSCYTGYICNVKTKYLSTKELNQVMNWENAKMFFSPSWFKDNNFVKRRDKGSLKMMLNNLEYLSGYFTNRQFQSRHRF